MLHPLHRDLHLDLPATLPDLWIAVQAPHLFLDLLAGHSEVPFVLPTLVAIVDDTKNQQKDRQPHAQVEDHPAAIHNYQRHGFSPYDQVTIDFDDPRSFDEFQ